MREKMNQREECSAKHWQQDVVEKSGECRGVVIEQKVKSINGEDDEKC